MRYYYLLFSIVFFIGSIRVYYFKKYEFRYYQDLYLGDYAYIVSIFFLLISIYAFLIFIEYKKKDKEKKD
jgi:uncharacterized membrane protein